MSDLFLQLKLYFARLWYRLRRPAGVIFLADGTPVRVRQLELYELDAVPFEDPGPFVYKEWVNSNGDIKRIVYDIRQWKKAPEPPDKPEPECEPGTPEYELWQAYNTYQGALGQRIKQIEAAEDYAKAVSEHILENCLTTIDRQAIKTPEDGALVYHAAMLSEVKMEDIEKTLDATFPGLIRWSKAFNSAFQEKEQAGSQD